MCGHSCFLVPAGVVNRDKNTGLVEAGVLDSKNQVAGFIAEAMPGFPHAETGNRRSKQKIKKSCVCVINIYFYIFLFIFSIRLYAGLKGGQKFREVGTDWYLKGDKSSGLDKKGTKVPGVSVVAEIGTLPPLIFHN